MNDRPKTILCYGDSNTWGYDPATKERFARDVRWTGVLAAGLGAEYEVIEEGLNGRTTVWDDPIEENKNGARHLIPVITSHKPLDLVIIMLGTNDLKARFSVGPADIAQSAALLAAKVLTSDTGRGGAAPSVLLMAPPPIIESGEFAAFFAGGAEKSRGFAHWYEKTAAEVGFEFFDTATVVSSSPKDGIHLEAPMHEALGKAVAAKVREILG